MLVKVNDADLPENAVVVGHKGADLFCYPQSGLSYVFLRGGIQSSATEIDEEWHKFNDLRAAHRLIASEVLGRGNVGPSEFTFIRKFLGITTEEFVSLTGCGDQDLASWVAGFGFQPAGVADSLGGLFKACEVDDDALLSRLESVAKPQLTA